MVHGADIIMMILLHLQQKITRHCAAVLAVSRETVPIRMANVGSGMQMIMCQFAQCPSSTMLQLHQLQLHQPQQLQQQQVCVKCLVSQSKRVSHDLMQMLQPLRQFPK
jgi:hypothetical protein